FLDQPLLTGSFTVGGDITLRAAEIYPATEVAYNVISTAPTGTISLLGNGSPGAAPLSAGGSVVFSAQTIVQSGVVRAPLGHLDFGSIDGSNLPIGTVFVPTQTVTFQPGSVTSVSAGNSLIPLGSTTEQTDWAYNAGNIGKLSSPPDKAIGVNGALVT